MLQNDAQKGPTVKDPMEDVKTTVASWPKAQGPGSGKQAWIDFAHERVRNEQVLWGIIDDQSAAIRDLQAEVNLHKAQIAKRKPKGGRPAVSDKMLAAIEADLCAGYSQRQAATRNGVSAMTASRVAARVAARAAQTFPRP